MRATSDKSTRRALALGVGNLLLSDEGAGLRVVEKLVTAYTLPETIIVLDGGTLGLDLLHYLDGVDDLLIVDAVEMGEEPGTLLRMEGEKIPSFLSVKMSAHQINIPDMLFAAKLRDSYPENVVLWGIQPGSLEVGLELTPPVAARIDELLEKVVDQLKRWGFRPAPRSRAPSVERRDGAH